LDTDVSHDGKPSLCIAAEHVTHGPMLMTTSERMKAGELSIVVFRH